PRARIPRSPRSRALARGPRKPAHGPRHRQPDLAATFRPGPRHHAGRFRRPRRPAEPPGPARRARALLPGKRLEPEGLAPRDRAVIHLPPVLPRAPRPARVRSVQRPAGPAEAPALDRRAGA